MANTFSFCKFVQGSGFTPTEAEELLAMQQDAKRYHAQLQAQAEILWDKWWLVDNINKRADEIMRGDE
mgnify:CR=1 FL=1